MTSMNRLNEWVSVVLDELRVACIHHSKMNSTHEGYAILKEEVDEVWDKIKGSKDKTAGPELTGEMVQVAAMAIRFLIDLGDEYMLYRRKGQED